ncbi:hypothetical protein FQZ97_794090 [compost metagenome]
MQISPWLQKSLAEVASRGVVSALTHKHDDEYSVNELLFENALQANNYALAKLTLEMRPEFDNFVDEFKTRTNYLIETGVLPESLTARLNSLDGIGFAVSDGYAAQDALAECERGRGDKPVDIIVSPKAMDGGASYKATIFHELVHAAAGHETGDYLREYLKPLLPDQRAVHDVAQPLEEALTEHITQVILGIRNIEDAHIEENPEAYVVERRFLSAIGNKVSMQELMNVYFGAVPDQKEFAKLKHILQSDDGLVLSDYFHMTDYDARDAAYSAMIANSIPEEIR